MSATLAEIRQGVYLESETTKVLTRTSSVAILRFKEKGILVGKTHYTRVVF